MSASATEPGKAIEVLRGEVVSYRHSGWHKGSEDGEPRTNYKFDDLKKAMYIKLIRMGMRRARAAECVGVSYATVLDHFKRFPDFKTAVSEAEMARVDEVEEALYATAIAGNVVAQQVVLFNRRPEEWADQRMMRARIEAAAAQEEVAARREAENALGGLREKLGELRSRLSHDDDDPASVVPDDEGEPVLVDLGGVGLGDEDDEEDEADDGLTDEERARIHHTVIGETGQYYNSDGPPQYWLGDP